VDVLERSGIQPVIVELDPEVVAAQRAAGVARAKRDDQSIVLRTRLAADEGAARREHVDVISEEFAGALAMAGLVLRRCGIKGWARLVGELVAEHERLPAGAEGELGPAPFLEATRALVQDAAPPLQRHDRPVET
jgi:hypothetical protein